MWLTSKVVLFWDIAHLKSFSAFQLLNTCSSPGVLCHLQQSMCDSVSRSGNKKPKKCQIRLFLGKKCWFCNKNKLVTQLSNISKKKITLKFILNFLTKWFLTSEKGALLSQIFVFHPSIKKWPTLVENSHWSKLALVCLLLVTPKSQFLLSKQHTQPF